MRYHLTSMKRQLPSKRQTEEGWSGCGGRESLHTVVEMLISPAIVRNSMEVLKIIKIRLGMVAYASGSGG